MIGHWAHDAPAHDPARDARSTEHAHRELLNVEGHVFARITARRTAVGTRELLDWTIAACFDRNRHAVVAQDIGLDRAQHSERGLIARAPSAAELPRPVRLALFGSAARAVVQ